MEYLAELHYGHFSNFEKCKSSIQKGLWDIQQEYLEFNINRDGNGVTISQDFVTGTIRLKQLPENMPEEIKEKIIALFQEYDKT